MQEGLILSFDAISQLFSRSEHLNLLMLRAYIHNHLRGKT